MLECPNCRQMFQTGARFCGLCGTSLVGAVPAAIFPDSSNMERQASSQFVSGVQAKDSPEDTLMRKKPDGFSWQSGRMTLSNESLLSTDYVPIDGETTLTVAQSVQRANGSSVPNVPDLSSIRTVHMVSPGNPLTASLIVPGVPTSSGMPVAPVSAGVATRPAGASFTIPSRPGRLSANLGESDALVEISDELALTLEAEASVLPVLPVTPAEVTEPAAIPVRDVSPAPVSTPDVVPDDDVSVPSPVPSTPLLLEESAIDPRMHFAPFLKPSEVAAHLVNPGDPYLHLKQELVKQRMEITLAMDDLLPLVYDNHREENQVLFAHILAHRPALDDEAWGHAAFVLGAYGNYMYRNPLSFLKKLEIWRAQLWAVYYERSYRRKYLAQRCQQLIHFFQGCAENPTFLTIALHDLETLYLYLEPGSLRKLQQMLQNLPVPPTDLLQNIELQMLVAEQEKAERMARQPVSSQTKQPAPAQRNASRPLTPATHRSANKLLLQPEEDGVLEEQGIAIPPEAHRWLGFWSEEQRQQFFVSLRADRLDTINQLLLQVRKQILIALRTELLNTSRLDYQRPRKSVVIRLEGRNDSNRDHFAEIFRSLNSPWLKDQLAALRVFERNARASVGQEDEQRAREWLLYARALTQGSTLVAPDWERAYKKHEASWEEIWNLAYYHRIANDQAEALRILAPGLHDLDAPVSHLRLALICALTLLLEPGQAEPFALQSARELLLRHLERWPHPLSCLAWLVLGYETPGALRPLAQSKRLSTFQALLEYPVDVPDPRIDLTESQIDALEDVLVNKIRSDEAWLLWLNDYAERRQRNYRIWQCLAATSERMERLERAETALQHIAGIYYDRDYMYAQEGEEETEAAAELRSHIETLFAFYRRHEMQRQAWDSFDSCYATLNHLGFWDEQRPANRKLLTLVAPFLAQYRRQEAHRQEVQRLAALQDAKAHSEIRRRELSNNPTRPLGHFKQGRRVGIFVDYENIARFIPHEEDMENVGQMLVGYAAQFGEVVCRWAAASPRNLVNLTAVRTGLEAAQFKIRYPRRELQFSASQKDLADYALLECLNNASLNDRLDVYLVVSGDRDYYERIYSLLENGHSVRILARDCNLSTSYRELEQQRQRKHRASGHDETDFFIDDLDEVLPLALP